MDNFGAGGSKEVMLEPSDYYGGRELYDQSVSGIGLDSSHFTNGPLNGALQDRGNEDAEGSSQFGEELMPEATGSGPALVMDSCQVHRGYEEVRHYEFIRYGIDELLGLWEVSVNCETTWNHVLTTVSPLMEEMCEMQAMPDTKYERRRSKNSERRQRFKARREAMLSVSQNKPDSDNPPGENKNNECDNTEDSNAQVSHEHQLIQIQKGPLKGRFKARQHNYDRDGYVESFQPQAFAVDGEPDFESGDPQDGWEYLRRVIWEAARCPKVVVASIDPEILVSEQTSYMPKIPAIPSCPPELLPSKDWESICLADFNQLRKELQKLRAPTEFSPQRLPKVRDKAAWEILCFGAVTSTQAEYWEVSESVTVETDCGASPGHEDIVDATDDELIGFNPPSTRTINNAVSGGRAGVDQVPDSPLLDELEGHSTRDDTGNDDSIQRGPNEPAVAERLTSVDSPEADAISASGGTEGPETPISRLEGSAEDLFSESYKHEGSSQVTADLGTSRRAEGSDRSDPNGSHDEDHLGKVMSCQDSLAYSDIEGAATSLLVTTEMQAKLEGDVLTEDGGDMPTATVLTNLYVHTLDVTELSNHCGAATEFTDNFERWPESSALGVDPLTPQEETSEFPDLQYDPVERSGDYMTYAYPAVYYDFGAHSHEAPEFEDDDLQTADLMESIAGFKVFTAKNLLEESEDECRESISEIDESVQQVFTRVFRVDKAWELPLIHTLLRLDVVSRATLFRYHVSWLGSVEDLPQERALWLLGLAAVVDTPLNADTTAAFRAMLRYCAGVRASKAALSDEELHMLNCLITVAGLYFGQAEAD